VAIRHEAGTAPAIGKTVRASAQPNVSIFLASCWHETCSLPGMSEPIAEQSANVQQLLKNVVHDGLELGRAELNLAKREVVEQARSLATSAILLLAALMLLQAAITTLGVLLVLMLRATAFGFVVVAALAVIAAALGLLGLHKAEQKKLHVGQRAKRDAREIMEAMK
jgi:hypothetical protein